MWLQVVATPHGFLLRRRVAGRAAPLLHVAAHDILKLPQEFSGLLLL